MDESINPNSDNPPIISRRKNLIPGVDDAHLALGGTALTLVALGIVSWPSIQDWISKTFKMPMPMNGTATTPVPPNGQAQVPPPPAVLPTPQQQQPQPEQELPYPYLRRQNIAPVGQAVSVSAMETVPDRDRDELPQQQQQQKKPQQSGYYSPFGASISGEVG